MNITYSLVTDVAHEGELLTQVRRLFAVEPSIRQRATDIVGGFASLDSLADLLHAQVVETPHVVFTIDGEAELTLEQQAFLLSHPEATTMREYSPYEMFGDEK